MKTDQASQAEWVRAVMDQHAGPLARYAAALTGDVDRARDVVQDTFVRLCAEDRSRVEPHLAEWLFTVCRNEALDLRRDRQRRVAREQAVGGQAARAADHDQTDPAAQADRRDSMDHMTRCLAHLPAELREMVYLKFAEELSLSEIAERLHVPRSTVALRVQQGMAMLNREFHGGGHD